MLKLMNDKKPTLIAYSPARPPTCRLPADRQGRQVVK